MSIDWEKIEQDLDSAILKGVAKTDSRLASRLSSVTRLTDSEVELLFPEPGDLKTVIELMTIVKSSEERNRKIKRIETENF